MTSNPIRATAMVDAKAFQSAVTWAARALNPRLPMPILSAIGLHVADGALNVHGFSYEIANTADVGADGTLPAVHVPGKLLADIAGRLTGDVAIAVDEATSRLDIRAGRDKFALRTMPSDDYPALPQPAKKTGTIPDLGLTDSLARVTPSSDLAATVPQLANVHLLAEGDTLTFTASDRYRIAEAQTSYKGKPFELVVNARRLNDLAKQMAANVTIGVTENLLTLSDGTRTTTITLSDLSEWPKVNTVRRSLDYRNGSFIVSREDLLHAAATAALTLNENQPLTLKFLDDAIDVSATGGELGDADSSINAVAVAGDELPPLGEIRVNHRYLSDALTALPWPYAVIDLLTPTKPVQLRSTQDDASQPDPRHTHIVMPIRAPK